MKLVAITGLSKESLNELKQRHQRTFEFHSANNVVAFSNLSPGDQVFLTDATPMDLAEGICGLVATVKGFDTHMQRVSYSAGGSLEEAETMSARAQLVVSSNGKIRSVEEIELYSPILVDVIEVRYCEAK